MPRWGPDGLPYFSLFRLALLQVSRGTRRVSRPIRGAPDAGRAHVAVSRIRDGPGRSPCRAAVAASTRLSSSTRYSARDVVVTAPCHAITVERRRLALFAASATIAATWGGWSSAAGLLCGWVLREKRCSGRAPRSLLKKALSANPGGVGCCTRFELSRDFRFKSCPAGRAYFLDKL